MMSGKNHRHNFRKMRRVIIHLGFHKTASTHFQSMIKHLSANNKKAINYMSPAEIRGKTFIENINNKNLSGVLNKIKKDDRNVFISDENLSGHTADIFHEDRLYENITRRLKFLKICFDKNDDIEIRIFIRNMATFLPSIYCEALLWTKFRPFSSVYQNNFYQSWIPVIKDLKDFWPEAKITIAKYEEYQNVVTAMMEPLVLSEDYKTSKIYQRIRERPSQRTISSYMSIMSKIPQQLHPVLLKFPLLKTLKKINRLHSDSFQPFNLSTIETLDKIYINDWKVIRNTSGILTHE